MLLNVSERCTAVSPVISIAYNEKLPAHCTIVTMDGRGEGALWSKNSQSFYYTASIETCIYALLCKYMHTKTQTRLPYPIP